MTPELKTAWIEALRSGRYEQGQQHLFSNGKYCCLGVLCEVIPREILDRNGFRVVKNSKSLEIITEIEDEDSEFGAYLIDKSTSDDECLSVIGLHNFIGLPDRIETELINMNDGVNTSTVAEKTIPKSFSEIADWIETHL